MSNLKENKLKSNNLKNSSLKYSSLFNGNKHPNKDVCSSHNEYPSNNEHFSNNENPSDNGNPSNNECSANVDLSNYFIEAERVYKLIESQLKSLKDDVEFFDNKRNKFIDSDVLKNLSFIEFCMMCYKLNFKDSDIIESVNSLIKYFSKIGFLPSNNEIACLKEEIATIKENIEDLEILDSRKFDCLLDELKNQLKYKELELTSLIRQHVVRQHVNSNLNNK